MTAAANRTPPAPPGAPPGHQAGGRCTGGGKSGPSNVDGFGGQVDGIVAAIRGVPLSLVRRDWPKVVIAGFFNVAAFGAGFTWAGAVLRF